MAGPEADTVLACIAGSEREPSLVRTLLVHNPVVIVERLVDCDQQRQLIVVAVRVGLLAPFFGFVLACGGRVSAGGLIDCTRSRGGIYQRRGYPSAGPQRNISARFRQCKSTARRPV